MSDLSMRDALAAMILEHDAGGITLATMREARIALAAQPAECGDEGCPHYGTPHSHPDMENWAAQPAAQEPPSIETAPWPQVSGYSGGSHPDGLYAHVTLEINGKLVEYVPAAQEPKKKKQVSEERASLQAKARRDFS